MTLTPEKQREYGKLHYKKNKRQYLKRQKDRREKNVEVLNDYKSKHGCQECGWNKHPSGLDFHHRDPSIKEGDVAALKNFSTERLMEEVEKCIVLCACCHRLVHANKH